MKPFDLQKALAGDPVVTRDGRKVTEVVHMKTARENESIVFVASGLCYATHLNGIIDTFDSANDLFMAPKIVKKEGWINIYKDSYSANRIYPSKEEADFFQDQERVSCIKIKWEEQE